LIKGIYRNETPTNHITLLKLKAANSSFFGKEGTTMKMNGKELINKMSDTDPKLIADAENKPRRKRGLLIGLTSGMATLAATAVIAVAVGNNAAQKPPVIDTSDPNSVPAINSGIVGSGTTSTQDPPAVDPVPKDPPKLDFSKYKDLPKITTGDYGVRGNGGGAYLGEKDGVVVQQDFLDYSDLEQASPWKGAELETMPVFMSHSTDLPPDLDKMYAIAREAAAALGIPEDSLEFTDNYQRLEETIEANRKMAKNAGATDEEIEDMINRIIRSVRSMTDVDAENEDIRISINSAFHKYITFFGETGSIKLPEGYNFTLNATDEEKAALVEYFAEKYKGILNYSKPTLGRAIDTGDRISLYIYDSDCDLTQQIVNYWMNYTFFEEHWENTGELSRFFVYTDDNCEKLGDYPILTAEQAEAILKSNKFDDEMRMPADAKILKIDMEYENLAGSTGVLPYYKFYVETDDEPYDFAELVCNVYSIPAVPEEFIDMETTDYGVRA